jgi:putative FmdB family regulatory protein
MPFYEYQCKQCDHHLEAMQKVSDAPLRKCPKCGKSALQRLMSAPVFRLKGGGWYETDFKGDGEGKRNLADRPEAEAPKEDKKDGKDAAKEATTEAAKPAEKAAPAAEKTEKKPAPTTPPRPRPATAAAPARKKTAKRPKSRR